MPVSLLLLLYLARGDQLQETVQPGQAPRRWSAMWRPPERSLSCRLNCGRRPCSRQWCRLQHPGVGGHFPATSLCRRPMGTRPRHRCWQLRSPRTTGPQTQAELLTSELRRRSCRMAVQLDSRRRCSRSLCWTCVQYPYIRTGQMYAPGPTR